MHTPGKNARKSGIWLALVALALVLLAFFLGATLLLPPPAPDWQPQVTRAHCLPAAQTDQTGQPTSLPATSASVVVLADDFGDAASSHVLSGRQGDVRYRFDNGAYLIAVEAPSRLAWSLLNTQDYVDVAIQATATLIAGAPTTTSSLIFRYQDDQNYYIFHVSYNGFYRLERLKAGELTILLDWTPSPAVARMPTPAADEAAAQQPAYALNTLRVELRGQRIALFANGVRLEETVDDTFQAGSVALAVHTARHSAAAVCFDNLLILSLAESSSNNP